MKAFLILLISTCCLNAVLAQSNLKIKGLAIDSFKGINLSKASVSVLKEEDSILIQFAWTKDDGSFLIEKLSPDRYILLICYPDYADYVEKFEISIQRPIIDLGNINLMSKAKLLSEVIIKGQISGVKVKGDTLEFNSKSFYVAPNAKVEDLLRQIPGLQVDNNGKISAYGQTVTKVLVEGEEFFGDDPTLVTKNIRADMVDKIQLYDKKSDNADFTGINDGVKIKTINIKLKEDKKRGYFGKIIGGISLSRYQQQQAMLNLFKNKSKFSIYGNIGNTGKVELSNAENDKYGINSLDIDIFQVGIITSLNKDNAEFVNERYTGQGLPNARIGGVHYDQKWNSDKQKINVNYKMGLLNIKGTKDVLSRNNLNESAVSNTARQSFQNELTSKKMDFTYEIKLDTSSIFKITLFGSTKNNNSNQSLNISTLIDDLGLLNQGERILGNDGEQQNFNVNALYNRKFKKPRRSFSLRISQYSSLSKSDGFLNSKTNYFSGDKIDSVQNINQRRIFHQTSQIFSGTINYTEPISKNISLILNYASGLNRSVSIRKIFNQSNPGSYDVIDQLYSNNFDFDEVVNRLGGSIQYAHQNRELRASLWASNIDFSQLNNVGGNRYLKKFTNFAPSASYFVNIPNKGWFSISYLGYATQPTIAQLQPVQIYEDPTNFVIGNPSLRNAFTHRINLNYLISRPLVGSSINLNGFYYITNDQIINDIDVDGVGKTTISFLNLGSRNTSNFSISGIYTKKIKRLDINTSIEIRINSNLDYTISNNDLIKRNFSSYTSSFNVFKLKPKQYSINFTLRPAYHQSYSAYAPMLDNSGFALQTNSSLDLFLPKGFGLNTSISYNYQAHTQAFGQSFNAVLVNASISKTFLKQENLKLSMSGNDLLNQNSGFLRNAVGSTINQSNYTTIRRYVLFSLSWDFSKFGTVDKTQN